jgi:hypothetical protein
MSSVPLCNAPCECESAGRSDAFHVPDVPLSHFHTYVDIDRDAQRHICRGNFLEAAKMYQVMIQHATNDLGLVASRAVTSAPCRGRILLRIHSQSRKDECQPEGSQCLSAPFNGLELCDSFFTFHAVYHSGQALPEVDRFHLQQNDEESLSVIVILGLYNLAMSFLWSEVVVSTGQREMSAGQMHSDPLGRALRTLQLVPTLTNRASLLDQNETGGSHNSNRCRKFLPLRTSLSLLALNNMAYIYSLLYNLQAAEASLARMEDLLTSNPSTRDDLMSALARYPRTVPFSEVCLLNLFVLHSPCISGAPSA